MVLALMLKNLIYQNIMMINANQVVIGDPLCAMIISKCGLGTLGIKKVLTKQKNYVVVGVHTIMKAMVLELWRQFH